MERVRNVGTAGSALNADVGVTIVRPVCGIENFSEETLGSAFHIDHPRYEILFCVADPGDPAVPLVRRLMAAYPYVPEFDCSSATIRSAVTRSSTTASRAGRAARHDWIVLADLNVLMPPDYVRQLMSSLAGGHRPRVFASARPRAPAGFWAEVECAFLNMHQARWQYAVECVGLGFAHGKSMLWRRGVLEANGGALRAACRRAAAEDAAATKLVRGAGLRVRLVDAPFEQPLGRRTADEVWQRQLRWGAAAARYVQAGISSPSSSLAASRRCWPVPSAPRRPACR